jgi:hypothetical protein
METLQIDKANALKAHGEATQNGKDLLENLFGKNIFAKNIRECINSLDDIFSLNGTTREEFETKWKGFASHEIANAIEVLIVAAYNQGELPDFTDGTYKYYPLFEIGSPSGVGFSSYDCAGWLTCSYVGSRLVFHGVEAKANMLDAVEKFLPEYQQSRTS